MEDKYPIIGLHRKVVFVDGVLTRNQIQYAIPVIKSDFNYVSILNYYTTSNMP